MLIGYRKYSVILLGMGMVFVGILTGKIGGDTGTWGLVALAGGYAGFNVVKDFLK